MADVPTVTLTGPAVTGDAPRPAGAQGAAGAPACTVRLGRRAPRPGKPVVRLARHLSPGRMTAPPPDAVDYAARAMESLGRAYLNDREGDCVIAGKAHAVGVWTGNDSDSGGVAVGTDAEVHAQYQAWCGPGDNGCVITDVLDRMKGEGLTLGGRAHRIDGYVAVDWTNRQEVQVALYLFGALTLGVNLPNAWTGSDVWDVTTSPVVGGHDVTAVGYDARGVRVASWGRLYTITWAAMLSRTWVEECYALLSPDWYGSDRLAPCGLDAATLAADLAAVGGGQVPDVGPPAPSPPPPAPPPAPPPQPVDPWVVYARVVADLRARRVRYATIARYSGLIWSECVRGVPEGQIVADVLARVRRHAADPAAESRTGVLARILSALRAAGVTRGALLALIPLIAEDVAAGKPWPEVVRDCLAELHAET